MAYIVKPHDMISAVMSTQQKHARAITFGLKNNITKSEILQMLNEMNNQDASTNCASIAFHNNIIQFLN